MRSMCYTEKVERAQQHPGPKTTVNPAQDNRKKQCKPNKTKPHSNVIHPRKRHNDPTHSHAPSCIKSTHTRRTYTGMHPVNRRVATQYLHTQSVTTCQRCGRNGKREAPRELSAHRGIGIAADQVEREVSRVAGGGRKNRWRVGC